MTRSHCLLIVACVALIGTGIAGCASPWGGCRSCTYPPSGSPAAGQAPASKPPGDVIMRGQSPGYAPATSSFGDTPGSNQYQRGPMPVSGGAPQQSYSGTPPQGYSYPPPGYTGAQPQLQPTYTYQPPAAGFAGPPLPPPPTEGFAPAPVQPAVPAQQAGPFAPAFPWWQPPSNIAPTPQEIAATPTPLDVFVEETRTGRFMFGVAVNSDAGVTGQITIDERNFDITRFPTSWDDVVNGTAWRGAGQGFRIEAQPGNRVQRYLVSFTEPYFAGTDISFMASAFYFDRNYFDWSESRYGGRLAWGYRLTPDLSIGTAIRAENVNLFDPRVEGVEELDRALGRSDLYTGRVNLTHDTRDLPFMPTEGHLVELSYEQAFGTFDYPRGELDANQYFMLRERPDGSGRHTLALSTKLGFSGTDTPIFENYFAGGFSTLRGYSFRGASPIDQGVRVGGEFRWINSVEYFFPLTADDMIKGVVFCDFGTVEEKIALDTDNFRVAPGFGFRINVPALGPAPLAFDFAFPVASADRDDEQTFSFFFGASRQ